MAANYANYANLISVIGVIGGYFFAPPEAGWKTWLLNVA
jgi:hypothetical protein